MPKIVDKAQMRSDIIDAALRVFMQKGFGATSMNDIAKEAHVAKGTLYLYFDSKEDLLNEIAHKHFEQLRHKFMCETPCNTLKTFLACLEKTLLLTKEERHAVRMFFEVFGFNFESRQFIHTYRIFSKDIISGYTQILECLQKNGEIASTVNPQSESEILFMMLNGMMMHESFFTTNTMVIHATIQHYIGKGLLQDDQPA